MNQISNEVGNLTEAPAGLTDEQVVDGAERMARVLLRSLGFDFSGETVHDSVNPRAVSAWNVVSAMLEEYDGTDLSSAVASIEPDAEEARITIPKADPAGSKQFFAELLNSVETLGGIADQYGSRTLADLMYLQNAIEKGTFIDHYPQESSVMVVVKSLPSADRWAAYIQRQSVEQKYGAALVSR